VYRVARARVDPTAIQPHANAASLEQFVTQSHPKRIFPISNKVTQY